MIPAIPKTVRAMNQISMTGPKAPATRSVPLHWKVKRRMVMTPAMVTRISWEMTSNLAGA